MFDHISKRWEESWKYDAQRSIFVDIRGVWKCGESRSWLCDISCQSKLILPTKLYLFLAPSRPPSNFTGQAPSSTELTLEWKPVDELHINGKLRAYVIIFFITHSPVTRHNITIPVTTARKRRAITDPSSPTYELSGLKKYTTYTVQVMAYTVDYGVPSLEINITTAQDGNLLN